METSQLARDIFLSSLAAIDIKEVVKRRMRVECGTLFIDQEEIELSGYKDIVLIGFGKASLPMGAAVEQILGDRFTNGILVTDRRHRVKVKSDVLVAGHPFPDSNSLLAGKRVISAINACDEHTLVIFLISGGGSSLVEAAAAPQVELEDIRMLNKILIGCGASISEINAVRKRISAIKGGKLGLLASRLRCIAVFVSDVNPGDVLSLASNPLLPEERKEGASSEVIERYGLRQALPEPIRQVLDQKETDNASKSWDWEGNRLSRIFLLDNQDVVKAAADIARRYEYEVEIDIANPEGDYRAVADNLISRLLELRPRYKGRKVCLISGGEVSCAVKGDGLGGRNQEFVLYSASRLAAIDSDSTITVLSCGTDGIDGNSNAAGAVAGADIVRAAFNQGIDLTDYFINSDSHSFFRQFGGVVFTGPTGNNVRDIRILLSDAVSHLT